MRIVVTLTLAAFLAAVGSSTATAADNNSVNSQVTDAVTQPNVKVIAEAPAVSIGTLYVTTAQSLQIMNQVNASPQTVMHAITVDQTEVDDLVSSQRAGTKDASADHLEQHLDAIHERLRECGSTCIMNIQVHGSGPDTSDRRTSMDALTEWIIQEESERLRSTDVATISYVGDGDPGQPRYRSPLTTPTSIDFLVQDVGPDLRDQIGAMR